MTHAWALSSGPRFLQAHEESALVGSPPGDESPRLLTICGDRIGRYEFDPEDQDEARGREVTPTTSRDAESDGASRAPGLARSRLGSGCELSAVHYPG